MSTDFYIIVIGAGIAGASVAAHLAETHGVCVLEMEERPAYHTTGRSAATYEPNYGPPAICALTRASRREYDAGGFLSPREALFLMPDGQQAAFEAVMAGQKGMSEISAAEGKARFPLLRDGYARRVILDPGTADIDVGLLHQSYLKLFKQRGGTLVCDAPVTALEKSSGWTVTAAGQTFRARIVVNAAGAWGDHVAELAGKRRTGLKPKRRSIAVVPVPDGMNVMDWAMAIDCAETWYCKPSRESFLFHPPMPHRLSRMMPMPMT